MKSEEIVILGAGLAGLTLAHVLETQGVPYQLLEARDRIGGRVQTITTTTGATIEMGATWFAGKHVHLMDLVKQLEVPFQEQYTGRHVLYDYANPDRTVRVFELPDANEPQYLFTGGTVSLLNALYQRVDAERVHLGQQVNKLEFGSDRVIITANKKKMLANKVINTLPPNLFLNKIEVTPALPEGLAGVSGKTHTWMGESIKVGLEYKSDFWRVNEIGTVLSQFGPVQELHDHQHEAKVGFVLKGFITPELHEKGISFRKQQVMDQMRTYFGPDLPDATYYEKDWQEDPLTYHPYVSEVVPHQYNGHPIFRESFFDGRLYFAGSETAQAFPGYLDGAVERGMTVAQSIMKERATMNLS